MTTKRRLLIPILAVLLMLAPRPSRAYNEDVHFNLTYVLCRLAGLPLRDSLWIANADQSMDENECTTAFPGILGAINQELNPFKHKTWETNGRNWHSFTNEGRVRLTIDGESQYPPYKKSSPPTGTDYAYPEKARQAVRLRFEELHKRALSSVSPPSTSNADKIITAEIAMGQFLHFEQDYFAHRQLTADCIYNDKFLPYGTFWGHFSDKHTPDEVGARPELAKFMIKDCYKYIREFVNTLYGKDMAQKVPDSALDAIIDALAQSYHATPFKKSKPYLDVKAEPTQLEANNAFTIALQSLGISTAWAVTLPSYSVPNNVNFAEGDRKFKLPYEKPETPLSKVKSDCIELMITSQGLK